MKYRYKYIVPKSRKFSCFYISLFILSDLRLILVCTIPRTVLCKNLQSDINALHRNNACILRTSAIKFSSAYISSLLPFKKVPFTSLNALNKLWVNTGQELSSISVCYFLEIQWRRNATKFDHSSNNNFINRTVIE